MQREKFSRISSRLHGKLKDYLTSLWQPIKRTRRNKERRKIRKCRKKSNKKNLTSKTSQN